jgi:antitoxin HicB
MKYHFKIHKESHGYSANCIELEGCRTQANTLVKLRKNAAEALNLFLSEPTESKLVFPKPKSRLAGKNIFEVNVEASIAIANRIRETRIENELTQHAMKDRLGIKTLSNYQRLEDPARANPAWTTLLLIKKAFPDFHVDDLMS